MFLGDDLTKLLYHSAFACYVKNRDGRYLYINDAGSKMLGKSAAEVIGQTDELLFTKEGFHTIAKEDAMTYYSSAPVTYTSAAKASALTNHPNFIAIKTKLKALRGHTSALLGVAIYDLPNNPIQPDMIRAMHQILKRASDFEKAISGQDGSGFLHL
ncbi:MAG: PAS domain-containing protein [Proteobacteria bacterium]|nr:MAG: PAS domain-containing protein [Pseudomonadota bacterium]